MGKLVGRQNSWQVKTDCKGIVHEPIETSNTSVVLRVGSSVVRVEVQDASNQEEREWELVGEVVREPPLPELTVAEGGVPRHLLEGERLACGGTWTVASRLSRAFDLGKSDCRAALEGLPQEPALPDQFPWRSRIYVILYDPSGDWP